MEADKVTNTSDSRSLGNPRLTARSLMRSLGMLPVLILVCIGFQLMTGKFLKPSNILIVMQQASINIVLATGLTFVILTGGIDLSVGAILAACAMASMLASTSDWAALAVPAALAFGLLFGLSNGALIAFMGLPPFIVTLGSLTAIRGIARLLGGDTTVFNSNLAFAWVSNDSVFGIPWMVVIAFTTVLASWVVLQRTVLGVRIYAVGGNADAARLTGIKVWGIQLFAYSISGVLAGLAGIMAAARTFSANGAQLGLAYELDAIAAVILGGTSFVGGVGSIVGTLIGALIIAVLSNGLILIGVSEIWQFIIKGLVIISAVALDRYRMQGSART